MKRKAVGCIIPRLFKRHKKTVGSSGDAHGLLLLNHPNYTGLTSREELSHHQFRQMLMLLLSVVIIMMVNDG